jgi:acetylornithine/N-succinyldiaminopimelate aminotransferase
VPHEGYLEALRGLCDRHGLLLILDEVQTGVGRTGKFLACTHEGVRPDIVTLGKGLGSGVPLAATIAREGAACFEDGDQGGTHCGNPLMAAVGNAVVDAIRAPGFLAEVNRVADSLRSRLESLMDDHPISLVRGRGMLLAIGLPSDCGEAIVAACRDEGLLVNAPRKQLLRFMPALTVSFEEVDLMVTILSRVLRRQSW